MTSKSSQIASDEQLSELAHDAAGRFDRADEFLRAAYDEAGKMLHENLKESAGFIDTDDDPEPEEVLDPGNIREIEVRAEPLECPRVTFWIREKTLPAWANTADRRDFTPYGYNAYNGDVTAVIDVRPF